MQKFIIYDLFRNIFKMIFKIIIFEDERYARAFHFPPYDPAYCIQNKQKIYLEPQSLDN